MNARFDRYNGIEASKVIGVSKYTLYRWAKEGRVPCRNVGSGSKVPRWEFSEEDIEQIKSDLPNLHRRRNTEDEIVVTEMKEIHPPIEEGRYTELLEENRSLRKTLENLRKEKHSFFTELLELMAKYE